MLREKELSKKAIKIMKMFLKMLSIKTVMTMTITLLMMLSVVVTTVPVVAADRVGSTSTLYS